MRSQLPIDSRPIDTNADAAPRTSNRPTLPVVYVSGSNETRASAERFATVLRKNGFDTSVFLVHEPKDPSTDPYRTVSGNSKRLPAFVDGVLARTHARKVDVVTWSQGGLVTRYWLKYFGGAAHVRSLTSMSGMIKGSPFQRTMLALGACPSAKACDEMSDTGKRLHALNTPTEALPGIKYFNITTVTEENAFPYTTNLMSGPGDYENLITAPLGDDFPVARPKSLVTVPFQIAKEIQGDRPVPAWLQVVPSTLRILVHSVPERAQIDVPLTEQLIVEYYSK